MKKAIETPTRLRLREKIQTKRSGQKMEQEKQLGLGPRRCEKFAETTWRTKLHTSKQRCRERGYVDSGASVHMMSKMELTPEDLETVKASRLPRVSLQRMDRSIQPRRRQSA